MQSLDQDSQLFENGITDTMFSKIHGIIVFDLCGTQHMSIVRTGSIGLECILIEPLAESFELILLNQFEIYWEITPEGSIPLSLAPWT